MTYLATVLPGLEQVTVDELTTKVRDAVVRRVLRGKIIFESANTWTTLFALRTNDNLYALIGTFAAGHHRADLAKIEQTVASLDLGDPESTLGRVLPRTPTFVVNASRSGPQTYSRFDAAAAAERGLSRSHPRWRLGTPTQHD